MVKRKATSRVISYYHMRLILEKLQKSGKNSYSILVIMLDSKEIRVKKIMQICMVTEKAIS